MKIAGIIANPMSGKDIRRLVAHGSIIDNQEKVRMVRRLLLGLDQTTVDNVFYMPDYYGIIERALRGIKIRLNVQPLPDFEPRNSLEDSVAAGRMMEASGAGCIIVLGGDGTSRAVMKGNVNVPVLPLSTGTNNVFPYMVEATIAGMAAGVIAAGQVPQEAGCFRSTRLDILVNGTPVDLALVDVAVYADIFTGSKAVWNMDKVKQVFLTRCRPENIGLSAIGGQIMDIEPEEPRGLGLDLGVPGTRVRAAIGPGLVREVSIASQYLLKLDEQVAVRKGACLLALDGEREVEVGKEDLAAIRLSAHGPLVVDIRRTMHQARHKGLFKE